MNVVKGVAAVIYSRTSDVHPTGTNRWFAEVQREQRQEFQRQQRELEQQQREQQESCAGGHEFTHIMLLQLSHD